MDFGALMVRMREHTHLVGPLAVLGAVFLILVPLPPDILDLFFTLNIVVAITILLLSTYIKNPVEFTVYPTILLMATFFRLALNVSSTRLILTRGDEGIFAAGKVIGSFGSFVLAGSFLIGIVIFVIIIAIQYMVVSHGAVRASEVTARFTLDKMPGKQMSIDADLNAGLITEAEAIERRENIEREAEFYGSMDGAIRFTAREALVSIIITIINIIGGILIGMFEKGMDFSSAGTTYTILTVGDGLMASIPSLLITYSGGIIATRAASKQTLGDDIITQTLYNPRPLMIAAGGVVALSFIPGLPKLPFFLVGGLLSTLAWQVNKEQLREKSSAEVIEKEKEAPPERIESLLKVDLVGLEIGYSLIQLVDGAQGGTLLQKIKSLRKQLAMEMGVIVPPVRIRDNLQLGAREYAVLIKGVQVVRGEVMPSQFLAINPGNATGRLKGSETKEPAFKLQAYWISEEERENAQFLGYTVVDAATVISTHLTEVIKNHMHELLGRQETQHLLETLAAAYPKVVEELVPGIMTLGVVQKVLQNLLKEKVSILDLRTILEALADYGPTVKDLGTLTELVRQTLARSLVKPYLTAQNDLPLVMLGGELESLLNNRVQRINNIDQLVIEPQEAHQVINKIRSFIDQAGLQVQPILLCSSVVRQHLRRLCERFIPELVVLSSAEIPANVKIVTLGVIE